MTLPSYSLLPITLMAIVVGGSTAVGWAASQDNTPLVAASATSTPETQQQEPLPLAELRTFAEVMERIKTTYVDKEVDDKTLLEGAIKGMLSSLDPHSAYLKPEDFKDLEENTAGQFGGLGMEVGLEDGLVKVVAPIDETPAAKAGIQAGDLVIKLDGVAVKGMTLLQAVKKMRGEPGSTIKLTILREGSPKPFDVQVKRDIINVQSVKSQILEDGYGYLRISQFQANTAKELTDDLEKLKRQSVKLKGLVLDLRNNPGGMLQAAVGVADTFLSQGLIVYTQGRLPNADLRFQATAGDLSGGVPLVVLINGGSASASEIVAGALQDHRRAVVVGSTSFGKGSVQTVLPLSVDAARGLKLTTALYYTPHGRSIQAEGIKPDIMLLQAKVTPLESAGQYKEADLSGHLVNSNKLSREQTNAVPQTLAKEANTATKDWLAQDYQLSQAVTVLKGLYVQSLANSSDKSTAAVGSQSK